MFRILRLLGILSILAILSGCAYHAAVSRLGPDEQAEFRAHSKIMNTRQSYAYLAKTTADERRAYLQQIGTAQRFTALDAVDQESVLAGYIRKGMSADAMRFLWGEPVHTAGYTGHYEYWYYRGSSSDLLDSGNNYSDAGTGVEVYLVDGLVDWWFEGPLDDDENSDADGSDRNLR